MGEGRGGGVWARILSLSRRLAKEDTVIVNKPSPLINISPCKQYFVRGFLTHFEEKEKVYCGGRSI